MKKNFLVVVISLMSFSSFAYNKLLCYEDSKIKKFGYNLDDLCTIKMEDLEAGGKVFQSTLAWGTKNCTVLQESNKPQSCLVFRYCGEKTAKSSKSMSKKKLRVACYKANKKGETKVDLGCSYNQRSSARWMCWSLQCKGKDPSKIILEAKSASDDKSISKTCALPKWATSES